ncbi:MAG: oligosaccharide flippase family protein, partial [Cyanobacteria bacterium J06643_5]
EDDLEAVCLTSYWLNWILCGSIALIQAIAAFPIAKFYGSDELIFPLITLSLLYLIIPFFLVQEALIRRQNRLKIVAFAKGALAIATNLITALLAILGMGVWAVVLGMLLAYPVQMVILNKSYRWKPNKFFKIDKWQEVLSYGGNLLGVSLLEQLRKNIDYLIVGKFLGVDALGIYFFAFNAGSGISNNVIMAFTSSMFPYFCEVRENVQQLRT